MQLCAIRNVNYNIFRFDVNLKKNLENFIDTV